MVCISLSNRSSDVMQVNSYTASISKKKKKKSSTTRVQKKKKLTTPPTSDTYLFKEGRKAATSPAADTAQVNQRDQIPLLGVSIAERAPDTGTKPFSKAAIVS